MAVNAFVSVINSDISHDCPFCPHRETVFHCFMECARLVPLFTTLERIFSLFGESFSKNMFILGYRYTQKHKDKCQLFNFLLGRAKLAIYLSRRKRIENIADDDVVLMLFKMLKAHLRLDCNYYKMMKDLDSFSNVWCYKEVICRVVDDQLILGGVLE